ncbi:hypothetical protein C6W96_20775 [Streptomyces sp. CS149]|nr:hypothetical protein C6W96_20775 [Streptomyces sp. CS149]
MGRETSVRATAAREGSLADLAPISAMLRKDQAAATARPSAPPTSWEVLIRPEATPASASFLSPAGRNGRNARKAGEEGGRDLPGRGAA